MYLKRTPSLLFQMLNRRLNYTFKTLHEKGFIYTRLEVFDQYFWLEVDLKLWQSYLEIATQHPRWPVSLFEKDNSFKFYSIFSSSKNK